MLHGGIRYLENGDFALVQEALYEKNLWLKLTPHLTYPSRFALPVYRGDLRPLWMVKTGILLYAALSGFRDQHHQALNPDETLLRFPGLKQNHLKGAAIYTDAIVSDAKLTYEVLWDGLIHEKHSYANSYCSLEQLQMDSNGNFQATVKDQLSGESRCLTPKKVVFATGPFTDHLLQKLSVFPWRPQLKLSRGSHIWLKRSRLPLEHPMVITPNDGRVIFLIPQNDRVLVGTTEANQDRPEFDVSPSSIEVNYLLANLNFYFPQAQIEASDILDQFAGMRPLVKSSEGGRAWKNC
jgi:glycerol-3-phosphate dehydrogenase